MKTIHLRYFVWKHQFDTIVDYKYELHCYDFDKLFYIDNNLVPIEIYNMRLNWGVKVTFYSKEKETIYKNPEINIIDERLLIVPLNFIIRETKKWIIENTNNKFLKLWYKILFKLEL